MKSNHLFILCACAAAAAMPALSQAHFLWGSLDPGTGALSFGLQEVPTQQPVNLGAKAGQIKAWTASGQNIRLAVNGNWIKGTTPASAAGAILDYGVLDRTDSGRGVFWLKYYAKAAATPGASESLIGLPVELTANVAADGRSTITVFHNGKPAAGAEVVVEGDDGKATFDEPTDAEGTATLPATTGPMRVRALVSENSAGVLNGKSYALIRSYGTLTVSDPSAKTLMHLLRESFGDMHDAANSSEFIKTVMAMKLTREQLLGHLQQRALIHEEADRILRRAHVDKTVYGEQQKLVLTLLKSDMQKSGLKWPTEKDAYPLTAELIKDMRESAKTGPYFALGVFHVYYGGITHGGRDIGMMIDQVLKTNLTYYQKSDGYDEYAHAVNGIIDPKAEQEMIRGADEVYGYVLKVNNLDVFKTQIEPSRPGQKP